MDAVDWILLAVLGVSVLLGMWRGLFREVISLAGWIAGFWLAQAWAPEAGGWLPLQGASEVLRYLAGTATHGITYSAGKPALEVYCDADYAGDVDSRRSTTGYVFTLNGGAISWSSRLQQTVAVSTTEAEYMAAAAAIKEALWMRRLLTNLGHDPGTITIRADSQSAIKLLKNPIFSMRSKHIDVIYHFARERVARKDVAFQYIKTDAMVADALTKPLPTSKFQYCRNAMGINAITGAASS